MNAQAQPGVLLMFGANDFPQHALHATQAFLMLGVAAMLIACASPLQTMAQTATVNQQFQASGPYKGCTISTSGSVRGLTGTCLGHTFKRPSHRPMDMAFCQLVEWPDSIQVAGCEVDGRSDEPFITIPKAARQTVPPTGAETLRRQAKSQERDTAQGAARQPHDLQRQRQEQSLKEQQQREKQQQEAALLAQASTRYLALVAAARARSKTDPTVFGIVLGEQWSRVQDRNKCHARGWETRSEIPFCSGAKPSEHIPAGQRGTTCVRINGEKLDTSWIASSIEVPESSGNLLMDALVGAYAFGLLLDEGQRCNVTAGILPNGTVGAVGLATSRQAHETIVKQLKTKYGSRYVVHKQSWTDGMTTEVYTWTLPALSVEYKQQAKNRGGTAFEGGSLDISTPAWQHAVADEQRRHTKPPL